MKSTKEKIHSFASLPKRSYGIYHLSSLKHAPEMASILYEVQKALSSGISPQIAPLSTGYTFFLFDREKVPIAIFKIPRFEREESIREIAAYRLDHEHFANVPPTVFAELEHPAFKGKRTGICQLFIPSSRALVKMDPGTIDTLSSSQIRKMAALDFRILNCDRHTSNILLSSEGLHPIDHELCLKASFPYPKFIWSKWKAADTLFTSSEKHYLAGIDVRKDHQILIEELMLDKTSADLYCMATLFLKMAAMLPLSCRELANLVEIQPQRKDAPFFQAVQAICQANPHSFQAFERCIYREMEKIFNEAY